MGEYVNSKQVQFNQSFVSCGALEAHHLPDVTGGKLAFAIATALYHKANPRPSAFVMFSDTVENGRGRKLAAFIIESRGTLGDVTRFGPTVNPKTGNTIELWVWHLNHENIRKWWQDELANRIEESQ